MEVDGHPSKLGNWEVGGRDHPAFVRGLVLAVEVTERG